MKRLLLILLSLFLTNTIHAQLSLTNNGNGTVSIEYGASADYSLYDPQGDSQVYVYLWVNTDQTNPNLTNVYNDDWNDTANMVSINYDNTLNKFVGQIDFNNHNFSGEGVLPTNVNLQDFNLILRNQAGSRQSADLLASNYGFQATVGMEEIDSHGLSYLVNGKLIVKTNQNITYYIYDLTGKEIVHKKNVTPVIDLNDMKDKLFIVKIVLSNDKYFVRKIMR